MVGVGEVPTMRLLVAGPGAVGGFLAARLAEAGHDVTIQDAEKIARSFS